MIPIELLTEVTDLEDHFTGTNPVRLAEVLASPLAVAVSDPCRLETTPFGRINMILHLGTEPISVAGNYRDAHVRSILVYWIEGLLTPDHLDREVGDR
jgi:hypothetical protein